MPPLHPSALGWHWSLRMTLDVLPSIRAPFIISHLTPSRTTMICQPNYICWMMIPPMDFKSSLWKIKLSTILLFWFPSTMGKEMLQYFCHPSNILRVAFNMNNNRPHKLFCLPSAQQPETTQISIKVTSQWSWCHYRCFCF